MEQKGRSAEGETKVWTFVEITDLLRRIVITSTQSICEASSDCCYCYWIRRVSCYFFYAFFEKK